MEQGHQQQAVAARNTTSQNQDSYSGPPLPGASGGPALQLQPKNLPLPAPVRPVSPHSPHQQLSLGSLPQMPQILDQAQYPGYQPHEPQQQSTLFAGDSGSGGSMLQQSRVFAAGGMQPPPPRVAASSWQVGGGVVPVGASMPPQQLLDAPSPRTCDLLAHAAPDDFDFTTAGSMRDFMMTQACVGRAHWCFPFALALLRLGKGLTAP